MLKNQRECTQVTNHLPPGLHITPRLSCQLAEPNPDTLLEVHSCPNYIEPSHLGAVHVIEEL